MRKCKGRIYALLVQFMQKHEDNFSVFLSMPVFSAQKMVYDLAVVLKAKCDKVLLFSNLNKVY